MAIDTAEKRKSISGIGIPCLIPGVTPNSGKDAEWRQESGWSYSGIAAGVGAAFVDKGWAWTYNSARYAAGGVEFRHFSYMRATTGTAESRLFDETAAAAVAGSTLTTTSSSHVLQESSALTLVDGNSYINQVGKTGADAGAVLGLGVVTIET